MLVTTISRGLIEGVVMVAASDAGSVKRGITCQYIVDEIYKGL